MPRKTESILRCIGLVTKVTSGLCGCYCKQICYQLKLICTETHRFIKPPALKRDSKFSSALCREAAMWGSKMPAGTPHWISPPRRKQGSWFKKHWKRWCAQARNVAAPNSHFKMCATTANLAPASSAACAVCRPGSSKTRIHTKRNAPSADASSARTKFKSLRPNFKKPWKPTNSTRFIRSFLQSKAPGWTSTSNFKIRLRSST